MNGWLIVGLVTWLVAIAAIAYWVRAATRKQDSIDPDHFWH